MQAMSGSAPTQRPGRMCTSIQAIKIARMAQGWSWTLIDDAGVPAAAGTEARQHDAMEAAWKIARSIQPWPAYPEVFVEPMPPSNLRWPYAARARAEAVT